MVKENTDSLQFRKKISLSTNQKRSKEFSFFMHCFITPTFITLENSDKVTKSPQKMTL